MIAQTTAVACPKCGGPTWDNTLTKRNPRAPDYKCRDKSCDGVVWPPRDGQKPVAPTATSVPTPQEEDALERVLTGTLGPAVPAPTSGPTPEIRYHKPDAENAKAVFKDLANEWYLAWHVAGTVVETNGKLHPGVDPHQLIDRQDLATTLFIQYSRMLGRKS